jgi:hypothetical protein
MKLRYLLGIGLFALVIACTKPNSGQISLKIASVSTNVVPVDGDLQVVLDFTDNGSTIDTVWLIKVRTNQHQAPTIRDNIYLLVPTYPGNTKGTIQLDLTYQNYLVSAQPPPAIDSTHNESDSLVLRFYAKDNTGHTSDTVNSGTIVVLR